MEQIRHLAKKTYEHRFMRYVLVGGTTFALDIGLFSLLHSLLGWDILLANTVSYWTAIAFNFTVNRTWTFTAKQTALRRNLYLYTGLLVCNFAFSSVFLMIVTSMGLNPQVAKIIATCLQTLWTYIAYVKVVFRNPEKPGS